MRNTKHGYHKILERTGAEKMAGLEAMNAELFRLRYEHKSDVAAAPQEYRVIVVVAEDVEFAPQLWRTLQAGLV